LLVSVDVADGTVVTFNSYETEDASRKSQYGKYIVRNGKEVDWCMKNLSNLTTANIGAGFHYLI